MFTFIISCYILEYYLDFFTLTEISTQPWVVLKWHHSRVLPFRKKVHHDTPPTETVYYLGAEQFSKSLYSLLSNSHKVTLPSTYFFEYWLLVSEDHPPILRSLALVKVPGLSLPWDVLMLWLPMSVDTLGRHWQGSDSPRTFTSARGLMMGGRSSRN